MGAPQKIKNKKKPHPRTAKLIVHVLSTLRIDFLHLMPKIKYPTKPPLAKMRIMGKSGGFVAQPTTKTYVKNETGMRVIIISTITALIVRTRLLLSSSIIPILCPNSSSFQQNRSLTMGIGRSLRLSCMTGSSNHLSISQIIP